MFNRYLSDATGAGETPPDTEAAQDASLETTTPPEEGQTPAQDATPAGAQAAPDSMNDLPDWAQKLIKELRGENASHRKAKKQAETEAEKATRKAAEEQGKYKELYETELAKREAAEMQTQMLELDALKSRIAAEVGLPQELASRLAGETEDEIKVDAQTVLAALPKTALSNDAIQGTGGIGTQTPTMSDEEIQEFAARYGVDAKFVKPEHFKLQKRS